MCITRVNILILILIPTFLAFFLLLQNSIISILCLAGHHLVIHLGVLVKSIKAGASLSIGRAVGEAFVHSIEECFSIHPALDETRHRCVVDGEGAGALYLTLTLVQCGQGF